MQSTFLRRRAPVSGAILLVVALTVALLAAPEAAFGKEVKIKGRGWGHGLGMSQYGAYGYAQHGWGARRILQHYYSGARVRRRAMGPDVRVGMLQGRSSITIRPRAKAPDGGRLVLKVKGNRTKIVEGAPGDRFRIKASSAGGARIFKNSNRVKRGGRTIFGDLKHPLVAKYRRYGTQVATDGKSYAVGFGKIEFVSYKSSSCSVGKCLSEVAVLRMQKYLYGLGEVPASWPQETLRAQAIAGRTYAYAKVRSGQSRFPCFCGVYDSTLDQVFIGEAKRTGSGSYWAKWKRAVRTTKRRVILHHGSPISSLYSSSSGGHTESNSNVWGTPQVPYLRGVNDPYDAAGGANPNYRWRLRMAWSTLKYRLASGFGSFGRLKRLRIVRKGVSGRVAVNGLKIVGSRRTLFVDGWDVRVVLGLKDSWFRFFVITTTTARGSSDTSSEDVRDATTDGSAEPSPVPTAPAPSPSPSPSPTVHPTP
ncbi:MAG: SpoIID/LytB domain-containing protein [Actinomycetota bacterium]|nr:SpoIID/LytB domain-containing protein [Actinomycetota bacterium]